MAISIFPSTAAEFVSNNFVVDMNDTTNNTADIGGVKQAGPYSMSFSSGDTSFDVYLIDDDGNSVGYSNSTSINASGLFSTVVILGVAQDEVVSFTYQGSVNNADGEGDEPGAGAYLESISPSDLPSIDDTATVIGGNFGADTEITFESGATVLPAKSITVVSGTELLVTRPDNLDPDLDPYTVRAVTTGVPQPTGTNSNILTDAVTAGAVPSWVTTSPLTTGTINTSYTDTLEATDADGDVTYSITSGSLPTGLSLDSSTGVISGTPTATGQSFTVTATDEGGNVTSRQFGLPIIAATGGTITAGTDGKVYHTFLSSDDFDPTISLSTEYILIAGGGGGSAANLGRAGGGAGGLLNGTATLSSLISIGIGAGGAAQVNGTDSTLGGIATSIGGGRAGGLRQLGTDGGSGGGAGRPAGSNNPNRVGGSGTPGQGNDGGDCNDIVFVNADAGAGGGGAGFDGTDPTCDPNGANSAGGDGGDGLEFADYATATSTGDGGFYAGGGRGGGNSFNGTPGLGGATSQNGLANTGAGGGGDGSGGAGGSGLFIVRY